MYPLDDGSRRINDYYWENDVPVQNENFRQEAAAFLQGKEYYGTIGTSMVINPGHEYFNRETMLFDFYLLRDDPCYDWPENQKPTYCTNNHPTVVKRVIWANYEIESGGVTNFFLGLERGSPAVETSLGGSILMGFTPNIFEFVNP